MFQKRLGQDDESQEHSGVLAAAETVRSAAASAAATEKSGKDEEKISVFWRVFGGTILSIAALVLITLYNNLTGTINDLRAEIGREREARTTLAKKEDVDTRIKSQWDRIRVAEGYKADIEGLKERTSANTAAIEATRKEVVATVDGLKKDTAGVEVLRERVAGVEALRKDVAGLDAIKEKVTGLTADLRMAKEEVQKLQQELERNRAADLERKAARDTQARQLDDTIKELQKQVQDCREKLARLEGAQPVGGAAPPKGGRVPPAPVEPPDDN